MISWGLNCIKNTCLQLNTYGRTNFQLNLIGITYNDFKDVNKFKVQSNKETIIQFSDLEFNQRVVQ